MELPQHRHGCAEQQGVFRGWGGPRSAVRLGREKAMSLAFSQWAKGSYWRTWTRGTAGHISALERRQSVVRGRDWLWGSQEGGCSHRAATIVVWLTVTTEKGQPRNAFENIVVRSLSRVRLFATPRTAARQASLSLTPSPRSSPKSVSVELVMPSNHLILFEDLGLFTVGCRSGLLGLALGFLAWVTGGQVSGRRVCICVDGGEICLGLRLR